MVGLGIESRTRRFLTLISKWLLRKLWEETEVYLPLRSVYWQADQSCCASDLAVISDRLTLFDPSSSMNIQDPAPKMPESHLAR